MRVRLLGMALRRQTRPPLVRALLTTMVAVAALAFTSLTPSLAQIPVRAARNVILMIGDGMGSAQVEAGRQRAASVGRRIEMESMPVKSLVTTTSISGGITDSAASATAMATGRKTVNGRLGVDADGNSLRSIAESVKMTGGLIGLVTN